MRSKEELSAAIQRAMKDKNISAEELRRKLDLNDVMLRKIISGEVVPSQHLEKELIEVLNIDPNLVERLVRLRQNSELRQAKCARNEVQMKLRKIAGGKWRSRWRFIRSRFASFSVRPLPRKRKEFPTVPWLISCKDCDLIFRVGKPDVIEIDELPGVIILRCPHCGTVTRYTPAEIAREMNDESNPDSMRKVV